MSLYGGPNSLLEYAQRRGMVKIFPLPDGGAPVLRISKPTDLGVFLQEIVEESDSEVERLFAQDIIGQMKAIQKNLTEALEEAKEQIVERYGPDAEMVEEGPVLQLIPKGFVTEFMKKENVTFSDEELEQYQDKLGGCNTAEQFLATFFD